MYGMKAAVMPELTVIISNYNQEKHLPETIDSVFSQRVDFPFRVIITDDCSRRDWSRKMIMDYALRYENIEPILAEENKGYLANVLRAKAKTKTKYFCLLDADDYWTDMDFLQRAYDFLEANEKYTIYESNVRVMDGQGKVHPFISQRIKSGSYSKETLMSFNPVPITQTTGMVFRNCIFINGIPKVMEDAVGTRSEKAFEGDTGRFLMHLKHGLAYYDRRMVGVYRLTEYGLWNSLPEAKKHIITARMQLDYFRLYDSDSGFFVTKAYREFQRFLSAKQDEFRYLNSKNGFIDEEERLMAEDVFLFCQQNKNEISRESNSLFRKAKQILKILKSS